MKLIEFFLFSALIYQWEGKTMRKRKVSSTLKIVFFKNKSELTNIFYKMKFNLVDSVYKLLEKGEAKEALLYSVKKQN